MIVVSDASPLIALERIERLDILGSLYEEVVVPEAVHAELAHAHQVRSRCRGGCAWKAYATAVCCGRCPRLSMLEKRRPLF